MNIKTWLSYGVLGGSSLAGSVAHAGPYGLPTAEEARYIAQECAPLLTSVATQRSLQLAKILVQSQGMRLVVQSCPFVRVAEGQMAQVLDVRVVVTDSVTAANFVRGPLADGEEVDMGDVHLVEPESPEDVSPDVEFNRTWLAAVMQRHGWVAVAGHWWAFVPAAPEQSAQLRK